MIPQILGGTIKVYAIAAPERLPSLPNVPTTGEAGVDFIFRAWNAMVAPHDPPNEIVAKLADALDKALDDPAVRDCRNWSRAKLLASPRLSRRRA